MKKRALVLAAAALFSLPPTAALAQAPPAPPPAPPHAAAAPAGEADARFRRGVELYKESDYAAALIEFRRAYDLDPRYQALYNIGETYFQLQDYANALRTLDKYLRDGGAQISAGRRDEVQKEIDKLRTRVATLEVTTNLPDVEIAVDDVPVGKTPLAAPLVVSSGRRKVTATRAGKPPVTQVVELAGGDVKKLALAVADDGPVETRVPVAPWVVTGVLVAGAVVTGVIALGASSAVKADLAAVPGNASQIASDHSKTFALALTTDILIGAAVASGIASIVVTVSANKRKSSADAAPAAVRAAGETPGPRVSFHTLLTSPRPEQSTSPSVRLGAGPQSVVLSGTF
jgi:Tetratricopeptide repeat